MAIIVTDHLDQSIDKLEIDVPEMGISNPNKYNVSNPHPGYGKDPNILNEYGHTMYPKWVKSAAGADVIVKDAKEEAEITGVKQPIPKGKGKAEGWS